MKYLKYILWIQLFVCVIFTVISFFNAYMTVQYVPKIYAYERILKLEKKEYSEDKQYEVLGFTPKQFAELSSSLARDNLEMSARLVLVFFIASLITLVEIFTLKYQTRKLGYNNSDSPNGGTP